MPKGGAEPPHSNGEAALRDGWLLIQAPAPEILPAGGEHDVGVLRSQYVFERRVEA